MTEPGPPELDLRAFFGVLRRQLKVLLVVVVVVAGVAVGSAVVKTPRYRSSAEILIGRSQAETIFNPLAPNFSDPNRLLANQIRVIQSRDVTDRARKILGFPAAIKARASTTEDVITLSAVDVEPKRAAAVANAYARAYLEHRLSSESDENAVAQQELARQIAAAEQRMEALDAEASAGAPAQRTQVRARQADEREALLAQTVEQRNQLSRLEAAANVARGGAQLLAPAPVPTEAFDPDVRRSAGLGLGLGLLLGLAAALLLDHLDNGIRSKEDLETLTGDLPVVGLVPSHPGSGNRRAGVVSLEDPTSAAAEAYRALRTSIQFLGLDRSLRTLEITSAVSSDGKTTTLVNLAVALARAGQRVVVVDCDLRRPRVHEFLGLDPTVGFTSVLVGDAALSNAVQRVKGVDNLLVLPSGPAPPNPSELLSGHRTIEILATLQADADIVLVDSPPVLPVSDAAALSTRVDATLVVVNAEQTQRKQLLRALEVLRQVEAVVVGTVLNRAGGADSDDDTYGYGYRPTPPEAEKGRRREPKDKPRHFVK